MFIDFASMMININYIVNIYKTEQLNKYYDVNIKIFNNSSTIKETYYTEKERNKRFDEIINIINNK